MTTICMVGGKLQGFEVNYLAHKAGMNVVLVDRREKPLIRNAVDSFHCFDVVKEPGKLIKLSENVDAIIPVNENLETIEFLRSIKDELACPLLFDFDAYHISMDKKRSKDYFKSIDIPTPTNKPTSPPYFVKPPCDSSSIGTSIIYDDEGLEGLDPSMLIEEYVEGDVISLEVIGDGTHFSVVKETKIHIDDTHDCHMVTPIDNYPEFRKITYELAKNLNLRGIMDVEAIDSSRGLKVLEIDARFPSQTPTAVYHSTGINLVEMLMQAFSGEIQETDIVPETNYCIYEHLLLENGKLRPVGEHVLSQGDEYVQFQVSEGLEIYESRGMNMSSIFTLISYGTDREKTEKIRRSGMEMILGHFIRREQEE
ncbi:3-methylornithine--L-lysine ligase PylC [Methanolobus bombayensis]|uniref:3-methylornithine--L-lysine ligase PylC n=1 Tax=Methanolobus bombayensis TaxID=38023 RepID=UPI001AE45A73|nr:3-methylornithine--L-lysine ligase PylC [Methanolobus bombayensis]MBP1909572.1 pyrrolysine biosynthesis protein PylC [Methanolobus bombayensis]